MRLSRCEVRDHINYRKNDRWRSHRFYRALQWLKSPMRYVCEIFGAPRFSSFSTQSARNGPTGLLWRCPFLGVDRKWLAECQNGANDPERSSAAVFGVDIDQH